MSGLAATDICREAGTVYSQLVEKDAPALGKCNESYHEKKEGEGENAETPDKPDKPKDNNQVPANQGQTAPSHNPEPSGKQDNSTKYGADEI